jgi:hypothetical protein
MEDHSAYLSRKSVERSDISDSNTQGYANCRYLNTYGSNAARYAEQAFQGKAGPLRWKPNNMAACVE